MKTEFIVRFRLFLVLTFLFGSFTGFAQLSSTKISVAQIEKDGVLTIPTPSGAELKVSIKDCTADGIPINYVYFSLSKSEVYSDLTFSITTLQKGQIDERVVLAESKITVTSRDSGSVVKCDTATLGKMIVLSESGSSHFYDEIILTF